jgi:hypothetical protein
MARILMQTTIPYAEDDWNVGRFSLLQELLAKEHDVVARNREDGSDGLDAVLATLDQSDFDEMWLFGLDIGKGLRPEECRAISNFRRSGGGLLVTRDHADLGSSICDLDGVGAAHHFHTRNVDPEIARLGRDDRDTPTIDWPNFHSGSNGDVQEITIEQPAHRVLMRADGSTLRLFPAHPHEGAVGAPPDDKTARVIARGTSSVTKRPFNLSVAFDAAGGEGNAIAESSFHHLVDYNWDTRKGCPSFLTEPPGDGILRNPALLDDIKTYCRNVAHWLAEN